MIANETILDRRPNDVVNNFRSFKDEQNLYRTKGTEMIQFKREYVNKPYSLQQ